MRLTDLNPDLLKRLEDGARFLAVQDITQADGLMFQCPLCALKCEQVTQGAGKYYVGAHYILCWFPQVPAGVHPGPGRWTPSGTSLENITLTPSVHLTGGCGWHGYVRDGAAINA